MNKDKLNRAVVDTPVFAIPSTKTVTVSYDTSGATSLEEMRVRRDGGPIANTQEGLSLVTENN